MARHREVRPAPGSSAVATGEPSYCPALRQMAESVPQHGVRQCGDRRGLVPPLAALFRYDERVRPCWPAWEYLSRHAWKPPLWRSQLAADAKKLTSWSRMNAADSSGGRLSQSTRSTSKPAWISLSV